MPVEAASAPLIADELALVLGSLMRRLREGSRFPISQSSVLARLEREGPQTTSALAAAERVRPQSMAQTLAELSAKGMIARQPHPSDRRQVLVELTDFGRQQLEDSRTQRRAWLASALSERLDADEWRILREALPLLRRLVEA